MADKLEISTFGNLKIQSGDTILKGVLSRKAEALLVYLACAGQPQPRPKLAELLWDERSEDLALSNLRTLISRLRPHLGAYLQITREAISLDFNQPIWLDLRELKQALNSTALDNLTAETANALEVAVALYGGEFLEGFYLREAGGFEEWVSQERERWHNQVMKALSQLVNYYYNRADYPKMGTAASRLLQLDPLQEDIHRKMMLMLAKSGQRTVALNHYRTYQTYLAQELDIAPEAITTDLYERIRKENGTIKIESVSEMVIPTAAVPPNPSDKIAQLKRVSLFADTPEDVLVELASLLQEVQFKAGELIFEKGELGQCMYIIAEGEVQVHNGNRTLNNLGVRDIFGEMAVLDVSPRLASVTTLTDVTLWQLNQETLYQLMAERSEVLRGIIGVLCRRLRERVQDVVDLDSRLALMSVSKEDR